MTFYKCIVCKSNTNALLKVYCYGSAVGSDYEYLSRLGDLVQSIRSLPHMQGFCYTQLTDVYQEVNGLLYFDRTPKQPLDSFKQIFGKK